MVLGKSSKLVNNFHFPPHPNAKPTEVRLTLSAGLSRHSTPFMSAWVQIPKTTAHFVRSIRGRTAGLPNISYNSPHRNLYSLNKKKNRNLPRNKISIIYIPKSFEWNQALVYYYSLTGYTLLKDVSRALKFVTSKGTGKCHSRYGSDTVLRHYNLHLRFQAASLNTHFGDKYTNLWSADILIFSKYLT